MGANALGLPIGYNTHARPELDLVAQQRIGGIANEIGDIAVKLFVVGTTGYAAADFRDKKNENANAFDTALEGEVAAASAWGTGIGTGGTFVNPSTLAVGEACCDNGANIVWAPASLGTPASPGGFPAGDWGRTYDVGPGPDGIPGCIGDNSTVSNGAGACNERLGDPAFPVDPTLGQATGFDDVLISYDLDDTGPGGPIPASASPSCTLPTTDLTFSSSETTFRSVSVAKSPANAGSWARFRSTVRL